MDKRSRRIGGFTSTANIISKTPIIEATGDIVGVTVTFSTNRGTSFAVYNYYGINAAQIMLGEDPANLQGERVK